MDVGWERLVTIMVLLMLDVHVVGSKVVKIAILTWHKKYKSKSDRKIVRNFKIH
jgi:hypothetical protein